ncbi:MAG TPA: DUF1330 domain-containing protein [Ilumatobacter sp.]|jgi:uncharacterized protein (DUF1330 family)|nr:DUF1330 domain-containing protein [Ilumatobacter sp.]
MTAYWVNTFRLIRDERRVAAYVELAGGIMEAHGGRFLARGLPVRVYEAAALERTTIIEFPSAADAIAAYESPAYQAALDVLGDGAVRDIRIIEAVT